MIKVLYAANNSMESKIQAKRILDNLPSNFDVKIAAYYNYFPKYYDVNWNLSSLFDIYNNKSKLELNSFNLKLNILHDQIKKYEPDLIISDFEPYISYIGMDLDIPIVQCSSSLIENCISYTHANLGAKNRFKFFFVKNQSDKMFQDVMLSKSVLNIIYSHFGDVDNSIIIKDKCIWARPYHIKETKDNKNNPMSVSFNNYLFYKQFKKNKDMIFYQEYDMDHPRVKNINNVNSYYKDLASSKFFVCEGYTTHMADAYYNNKFCWGVVNHYEPQCILNMQFGVKYKISNHYYKFSNKDINIKNIYDSNILNLSQILERMIK